MPVNGVLTVSPNRRILSDRLISAVRRKNRRIPISTIVGHDGVVSILKIISACSDYVDYVEDVENDVFEHCSECDGWEV